MDSFIFDNYTKRLMNGEVNSAQVWNFLPVNRHFIDIFEDTSAISFRQFRNTADIGCYSSEDITEPRENYLKNLIINNNITFKDVVSSYSGLVVAESYKGKFVKDSDSLNQPIYIDDKVSDEELKQLYNIQLNDTHRYYQKNGGFYYVTKVTELNWLSDRCNSNNTFNICLGDNIFDETISRSIGNYEHPFQGTFDGAGYVLSSCIINVENDLNGVIGVLGNEGVVKNVQIADMSFYDTNTLTTSYAEKYSKDINVGFVAKNYGEVINVSSIGDNYVYGLSPSIYFEHNSTDDVGDKNSYEDNDQCYLIDTLNLNNKQNTYLIREGYSITLKDGDGISTFNNLALVDTDNEFNDLIWDKSVRKDFLILSRSIPYKDSYYLEDWYVYDGKYHELYNSGEGLSGFMKRSDNFEDITSHRNINDYKIVSLGDEIGDDFLNYFKDNDCFYNVDNKTDWVKYFNVTGYLPSSKTLYLYGKYSNREFVSADSGLIKNLGENIYYKSKTYNTSIQKLWTKDNENNINPYFGYYGCRKFSVSDFNETQFSGTQGFNNNLKLTYIVSPIVGSNYNIISGCLNNSNVYFGIDKNKEHFNPFAGEYGGIAGYSEGNVISNESNITIKSYDIDNLKPSYKVYSYCNLDINILENINSTLFKKYYERINNNNPNNCLIFGNIIGRTDLYNDTCLVESNNSKLYIEELNKHFNTNYTRPSSLIGSVNVNTNFNYISAFDSIISGNSSVVFNDNTSVSSTFCYNELNLRLDNDLYNVNYYDQRLTDKDGYMYEYVKEQNVINKEQLYINSISSKFVDNEFSANNNIYNNISINIPSTSFIENQFSYINPSNALKNCEYKDTEYTEIEDLVIKPMEYELKEDSNVDQFFDIKRYIIKDNNQTGELRPLSANVYFDFNNANFVIKDKEMDLSWGYSGDVGEILKVQESYTGNIINSKDFAGVIIYDNEGNLVAYKNNYSTNVIYDRYRMNFENDVVMEFK